MTAASASTSIEASALQKATSGKGAVGEALVAIEPGFPVFAPRPSAELPHKRIASFLLVNTSSLRLIFKIEPSEGADPRKYVIRPAIDYLLSRSCRPVTISILNDPPQVGKEHEFTYHVVPLAEEEGLGVAANEYWTSKKFDKGSDKPTQDGQFICVEPEPQGGNATSAVDGAFSLFLYSSSLFEDPKKIESDLKSQKFFKRRQVSRPDIATTSASQNGDREDNVKVGRFMMRPAPTHKNIAISDDELMGPPTEKTPSYQRVSNCHRQNENESEVLRPAVVCNCQLSERCQDYFWQNASSMRAFCYGFLLALIPMGIIALKKSHS
uniref:MSP domain-containing protein n=1 Tax=Ascaris lumbricoides TaxID=6252 RepID=A0A9J2P6Y1_ASCLU